MANPEKYHELVTKSEQDQSPNAQYCNTSHSVHKMTLGSCRKCHITPHKDDAWIEEEDLSTER